jgi:hypothetical protein
VEPTTEVAGIPNRVDAPTAMLRTAVTYLDLDRCDSQSSTSAAALRWPDTMLEYDTRDATRRRTVRRAAAIDKD